jgi:hypothetical protein
MVISGEKAVYHVMSRTALDGFLLQDVDLKRIQRSKITRHNLLDLRFCFRNSDLCPLNSDL